MVNPKIWHEIVDWRWLRRIKVDFPRVVQLLFSVLGELQRGLDVIVHTEVRDEVVDRVIGDALILVVGQEAVAGLLRSGAGWVILQERNGSWVVSVMFANVDGG